MLLRRQALIALLTLGTAPATAEISLMFPVDCTLGETCFLQQFVDRDPGPGARDFTCGPQSYDGHTGTDIRTADFATMAEGVAVVAAADGVVRAVRDGVPDRGTAAARDGQGCGNGVAITHPDGWETQYCHLMNGSLTVAPGDRVAAGQALGRIGYSGRTEFPHLEFLLRRDGDIVDPFDPGDLSDCATAVPSLWTDEMPVSGGGILSVGFAGAVPDYADIQDGTAHSAELGVDADAIVIWAFIHNGRAGDLLRLSITTPAGAVFHSQDVTLERTQAQLFRATGRRASGALAAGDYAGTVTLVRDGTVLDRRATTVRLR